MKKKAHKKSIAFTLCLLVAILAGDPSARSHAAPPPEEDGRNAAKTFLDLDPINFNLIREGRVQGAVSVEMVLELEKANEFEEIAARKPQIQSDFLQALVALAKARFRLTRPIDPNLVAGFLQPVVDKRLGKKRVKIFVRHATITPNGRR